ncbi:MAG: class I SAM-dependent methyltransferase [Anaerolineae bacterium]|nr:class I SAM-dependent methyltransferase [Anaerolineae bacterium]
MGWVALGLGAVLVVALLYWQLIIAEGAYLGRRVVTLLYDWSARVYDRIKQFDPGYEQWFLGLPLSRALALVPDPLILDVATGTGRLARTLFRQQGFHGRLIGLDLSRRMLREAVKATEPWADRIIYLWRSAGRLPFPDDTFDAVSCLEALEFMPSAEQVLFEMLRVLRPGGLLMTTNRIGKDARLLPGRAYSEQAFEGLLRATGFEMVRTQPWQEDYDLIWARKAGVGEPVGLRRLEDILRCPGCGERLYRETDSLVCAQDAHRYPIAADGVIEMQ